VTNGMNITNLRFKCYLYHYFTLFAFPAGDAYSCTMKAEGCSMAPRKTTTKKPKTRTKAGSQPRAVKKIKITEDTPLLAIERRFCDEYLIDLNQRQAAIRAGYSPRSAAQTSTGLRKQANVSAYIARRLAEQSARTGIESERILREAARIAFANITDLADDEGRVNLAASREDTAAISSIKYKRSSFGEDQETEEREIKLTDKNKALDLLMKYGRVSAEFERKMKVEEEKLRIMREQLELEKRRVAIQEAQAAQEKDGFNKIISIIDPFGEQHQHNETAGYAGETPETNNKSTNAGGESV